MFLLMCLHACAKPVLCYIRKCGGCVLSDMLCYYGFFPLVHRWNQSGGFSIDRNGRGWSRCAACRENERGREGGVAFLGEFNLLYIFVSRNSLSHRYSQLPLDSNRLFRGSRRKCGVASLKGRQRQDSERVKCFSCRFHTQFCQTTLKNVCDIKLLSLTHLSKSALPQDRPEQFIFFRKC